MSERENSVRTAVVTYFPMFIAALSLLTAMSNGYLSTVNFSTSSNAVSATSNRCRPARTFWKRTRSAMLAKVLSQAGERARKGEAARHRLHQYVSLAT
jgi:hypothetical protein